MRTVRLCLGAVTGVQRVLGAGGWQLGEVQWQGQWREGGRAEQPGRADWRQGKERTRHGG
jgi:hypothetical protein